MVNDKDDSPTAPIQSATVVPPGKVRTAGYRKIEYMDSHRADENAPLHGNNKPKISFVRWVDILFTLAAGAFMMAFVMAFGASVWVGLGSFTLCLIIMYFVTSDRQEAKSGQDSISIDVELTPSTGQRADVRLSVKNNGAAGKFSAQCQILAARNDPNQLKTGVFNLPWRADKERVISISKGETQELLIARWKCLHGSNFCQLDMLEWTTKGPADFWGVRWDMPADSDSLPEFDLEITLIQQGATKLKVETYVLRPINCTGPLEMMATGKRV